MELSAVLYFCLLITLSKSEEYYVSAPNGTGCPVNKNIVCHNLSYYVNQSEVFLTSNTVLTFLEGTHILEQDEPVVVRGVSNLTLQGLGEMEDGFHWTVRQSNVFITCEGSKSGIFITDFFNITISKLTIIECGVQIKEGLLEYVESNYSVERYNWEYAVGNVSSHSLLLLNGSNVIINELSIQNGTGYGLTSVNVYDISMNMSYFSRNNYIECTSLLSAECRGGNVRIAYIASTECPHDVADTSLVSIMDTSFSFGLNVGNPQIEKIKTYDFGGFGGGLAIFAANYNCSKYEFQLENIQAYKNTALFGGNIAMYVLPVSLKIVNLNSTYGNHYLPPNFNVDLFGAGLYLGVTRELPVGLSSELIITNSRFTNGSAQSATGMKLITYTDNAWANITIESCTLSHNTGWLGNGIMWIEKQNTISSNDLVLHMRDINVFDNGVQRKGQDDFDFFGAVILLNTICYVSDLRVFNHPITGMTLFNTFVHFSGYNLFQNNSYYNGGGMTLLGSSSLILHPATNISFIENHANGAQYDATGYGGAIYIPIEITKTFIPPCFFQIYDPTVLETLNITIYAIDNTADITGTFLSGGQLNVCDFVVKSAYTYCVDRKNPSCALSVLKELLYPKPPDDDHYFISSVPIGVTLCQNDKPIPNIFKSISTLPGKAFNISLTTVGENVGISPGKIIVTVLNCTADNSISEVDTFTKETENKCANETFTLNGNDFTNRLCMILTTPKRVPYNYILPVKIFVEFEPCPDGFSIYNEICDCNEYIRNAGATCDINTTSITTDGNIWIGYDNSSNCTLVSGHCPYDYCVDKKVNFSIDTTDLQCNYHRSGILCGECAEGYSLLLGGNKCGICPNDNYLSLLLVFGVAGVALVVLLIGLNLTVSVGTINGLIFYANIVKLNEDIFFPRGPIPFLSYFISWINLDLGIETCFYEGMTPYAKVWLQFAFPVYIWLIIGLIIIMSRYSSKVARLVGTEAVPILATLLLLSYTKIIRTLVLSLRQATLHCNSSPVTVWQFDGSIHYFQTSHTLLVVFAISLSLFLVLPYTLFLILLPIVEKVFSNCGRLWLNVLKPFCDAYSGPFKDHYRFWSGILIVARVLISVVIIPATEAPITLYSISFGVIILLTFALDISGPYKKRYLNVFESWFLANILGLSILALGGNDMAVLGSKISISLVFVSFVVIVIIHILARLKTYASHFKYNRLSEDQEMDKKPRNELEVLDGSGEQRSLLIQSSSNIQKQSYSHYRDSILNLMDSN